MFRAGTYVTGIRADRALAAVLGHLAAAGERRTAERTQIHPHHLVPHRAQRPRDPTRRLDLPAMALAIVHRQRGALQTLRPRGSERHRAVEPAREQHDGASSRNGFGG
jgi:hypothetical protein